MKKLVLVTLGLFTAVLSANAQEVNPCGTYEAEQYLFEKFPGIKAEYDERMALLHNNVEINFDEDGAKSATFIIPVVFHILHEYGSENVSDGDVYDLMESLNEDYSATNSDISAVVPEFQGIIGDVQVEFRLAALDPFGNCTNGIEHIYTHETSTGESQIHKVGQWNRAKYLNIWVTAEPGAATQGILLGYATFPTSTDGSGFWTDGVVLRSTTVSNNDRTLTHEIGHWLGLCHTFGCTGTADDGLCEDDNVPDVPITDGSFSTCILTRDDCNPGTLENVQNYMDYSSCTNMFSQDQVTIMHNTLDGIAGQRNIIWSDSVLTATGVINLNMPQDPSDPLTVPTCTPVADFHTANQITCIGDNVDFEDASWNAVITSRLWDFGPDATPQTSTSANPSVSWSTEGYKTVTLTVTNAAGEDTKVLTNYVYVAPDWADYTGPVTMDIEGNQYYRFVVQNPEFNYAKYQMVDGVGYDNSRCFKLGNYRDISNADEYTDEWFYNMRLGGSVDKLITPAIDLANTSGVTVKFKYAYATNATDEADITEELKVSSTRNCGVTWVARKTLTGSDVVSAGFAGNADFTPTSNLMWKEASFTYTPTAQDNTTRFMFEFTASDLASNLYIDNIQIDGFLGLTDETIQNMEITVYPNPTSGEVINVNYLAQNEPTEFILRDVQGKVICTQIINTTNAEVTQSLEGTENLSSAPYFLEIRTGDHSITKKVIVL